MLNNRNYSRSPMNSRNMQNMIPQMSYDIHLDIEKAYTECIDNMPIAMAYVPFQQWRNLYEPAEAFQRGTIFKELDLPFNCAKECK